jgi:hypothetical protein
MMECEAKAPDISHMDFLYDEIDDIWMENEKFSCLFRICNWLTRQGRGYILIAARLEYFHASAL